MRNGFDIDLHGRLGELSIEIRLVSNDAPLIVIGPNGAGKTTLLRSVVGAHLPLEGRISLGGRTFLDSKQGINLPPEARRVGYVPQGFALFPHLTALGNVTFGCSVVRGRSLLAELGAAHLESRDPSTLSGGEKQRIALARALSIEPLGLLLDEPLSALDAQVRRTMRIFLAEYLRTANRPALVVSHDAEDVHALGGDVVAIEGGRITQRGSARELAESPATEFVAAFFDHGVAS